MDEGRQMDHFHNDGHVDVLVSQGTHRTSRQANEGRAKLLAPVVQGIPGKSRHLRIERVSLRRELFGNGLEERAYRSNHILPA